MTDCIENFEELENKLAEQSREPPGVKESCQNRSKHGTIINVIKFGSRLIN